MCPFLFLSQFCFTGKEIDWAGQTLPSLSLYGALLGSLRYHNGKGSKNITSRVNLHPFDLSVAIILTCFLCQMQGNSFWVKFRRTISKFKKEKKISSLLTSAHPPKKGETRQFHLVHVVTQYKKVFCICEVVVLLIKHIALWIFSLLLPL